MAVQPCLMTCGKREAVLTLWQCRAVEQSENPEQQEQQEQTEQRSRNIQEQITGHGCIRLLKASEKVRNSIIKNHIFYKFRV